MKNFTIQNRIYLYEYMMDDMHKKCDVHISVSTTLDKTVNREAIIINVNVLINAASG